MESRRFARPNFSSEALWGSTFGDSSRQLINVLHFTVPRRRRRFAHMVAKSNVGLQSGLYAINFRQAWSFAPLSQSSGKCGRHASIYRLVRLSYSRSSAVRADHLTRPSLRDVRPPKPTHHQLLRVRKHTICGKVRM